MNKTINVGTQDGTRDDFRLPLEVQTVTTAVLGIRGSGKTNTAGRIVEGLIHNGRQCVIVDPTDAWWGLKSSRDGKDPGFPIVVIGGEHGDISLGPGDGAAIADFLVEERVSAVISLRHMRKGDQRHFVTDLTEQLFHRKGKPEFRTPLLYVIDECDLYIPQRVGGAEARMVGAVEDIVRRGRNAGLGCMLISQRAASVNKDVLTQLELLVAHRHTSPQDRKALLEWVEAHDVDNHREEFLNGLGSLKVGTAWFWSPGWLDTFRLVRVAPRTTFDSSATPQAGQKVTTPRALAEVDLAAIRGKLAQSIEKAKADDPKELRRQISELQNQLADAASVPAGISEEKYNAVLSRCADQMRSVVAQIEREAMEPVRQVYVLASQMADAASKALGALGAMAKVLPDAADDITPRPAPVVVRDPLMPAGKAIALPKKTLLHAGPGTHMSKAERSILTVLAQVGPATKNRIAVMAQYSVNGGGFNNALSSLRTSGRIEGSDPIQITDAGRVALGSYTPLPRGRALVEHWMNSLSRAESMILNFLKAGGSHTKEAIAEACGYEANGGGFNNALSRLRTLELITRGKSISLSRELSA